MFQTPPPPPPSYPDLPWGVEPEAGRRSPTPNQTWAWIFTAFGGLMVVGYFFLASIVAIMTLGGEPSEAQQLQSDRLVTAAGLMLLLTPVGAVVSYLVVRWADDRDRSGTAFASIVCTWPVAFAAGFYLLEPFPSDDRPLAFGAIWAVGGMVVGPLVGALAVYAGASRSRNRRANA